MSLYNMLFGMNPDADNLLALLNLTRADVGRFRDCYVAKDDDGEPIIVVHTRNGGGNREDYMPDFTDHPLYLSDADDDFDCTYADILFRVPEEAKAALVNLPETMPPAERWQALFAALGKPTP